MRIPIPSETSEKLLYQNRHICSRCREDRKHVQIHHIDGNPSNNKIENLAVLCLDCHSLVTGNEGLGRSYSPNEVSSYKKAWEKLCIEWLEGNKNESKSNENNDDDDDEVIDSDYIDDVLESNTHIVYHYELDESDGVSLWVKSEEPIDIAIVKRIDYENWHTRNVALSDAHELLIEEATEEKEMFIAKEGDEYSVIFANFSSETISIQADISIWEFD